MDIEETEETCWSFIESKHVVATNLGPYRQKQLVLEFESHPGAVGNKLEANSNSFEQRLRASTDSNIVGLDEQMLPVLSSGSRVPYGIIGRRSGLVLPGERVPQAIAEE
jgi:hypothetical protein